MASGPELPATLVALHAGAWIETFPNLTPENHRVTSDRTTDYNCIAWAAGNDSEWWWPAEFQEVYWPEGVPRIEDLASFVAAFATLDYAPCEGDGLEAGVEKVVIYAIDGVPSHAARQLPDGWWTSKLGHSFDVAHTLDAIGNGAYGEAVIFLGRPAPGRPGQPSASPPTEERP
jgi:hypothetical protein